MATPTISPDQAKIELARLGVKIGVDVVFDPQIQIQVLASDYQSALSKRADELALVLEDLWTALCSMLESIPSAGSCSVVGSRMAVCALEGLCTMSAKDRLNDQVKHEIIRSFMASFDVAKLPTPACSEISALLSKISLHEYMITRLSYKHRLFGASFPQKTASVMDGPYGRLDLPMGDRVIPWRDIEESIEGDSTARKSQYRYRSWTEAYNEPRFRPGFYWRELATEPYLIDNAKNESPYKYREYLWRHLG